jgi:hypothetical protein
VINNEGETSKEQQRSTHYFKFVVFMLLFLPSKPLLDYSQKTCMFGSVVTRIDFDRIDSVKLILDKIDFKLKWFMFGYIHAKVS